MKCFSLIILQWNSKKSPENIKDGLSYRKLLLEQFYTQKLGKRNMKNA